MVCIGKTKCTSEKGLLYIAALSSVSLEIGCKPPIVLCPKSLKIFLESYVYIKYIPKDVYKIYL